MKKIRFIQNAVLICLFFLSTFSCAQDKTIAYAEVPQAIQLYVKQHFSDNEVVKVKIEEKMQVKEYEIFLNNNIKLEFNNENQIKKITSRRQFPESVLPAKINTYVKENYPNQNIREWKLKKKKQEIELNNGLELEFTLSGDFLRID